MTDDTDILRAAAVPVRVALLEMAANLTGGDRNRAYGEPVENMAQTAAIFNALTGHSLTATDAATFCVALKLARLRFNPTHHDSHVDAMAYIGIRAECAGMAE